jgi:hypothetical protein
VPAQHGHSESAENKGPRPRVYLRFRTRKACWVGERVERSSSEIKDASDPSEEVVVDGVSCCTAEVRMASDDDGVVAVAFMRCTERKKEGESSGERLESNEYKCYKCKYKHLLV